LSFKDAIGTFNVGVKFEDSKETTFSGDELQFKTDSEVQKYRYQRGLETLVVYTLTDEYCMK